MNIREDACHDRPPARLQHARHPCRSGPRCRDGRPGDADLPDHVLRLRRRRPCGLAVRSAGLRQHLFPHRQPDLRGAGRARRGARGRHGGARGGLRPCGRVPGASTRCCSPATSSSRPSKLYGGSINQFNHSYKNFGWNVVWANPDDPSTLRGRHHAEDQGDLHRIHRQSGRRDRRSSRPSRRSPRSTASRSSSTTRWRRPT